MKFRSNKILDDGTSRVPLKCCKYRNCEKVLSGVRSDANYCSLKCRNNERTYIKRENRRVKKEKEEIAKLLHDVGKNGDLLELFKKIYG